MFEPARLNRALAGLGAREIPERLFRELARAYREPGRFYHTERHVGACLQELEACTDLARAPDAVAVALWFHDAVYDTRRSDNEARSAAWAVRELQALDVPAPSSAQVERMILATATHEDAEEDDVRLMLDLDLAVLGAPAAEFDTYDADIRREYAWVPQAQYREGRARVLRSFLDRPRIYATARFLDRYEETARANLTRALARLEDAPSRP